MRRATQGYTHISSVHGQKTNMGMYGKHLGYDYAGSGMVVVAPEDMTVISVGTSKAVGNFIEARGNHTHRFLHLKRHSLFRAVGVSVGQVIKEGTQIAISGNTGITTGPHLHHDTRKNNTNWNDGFINYVDWEQMIKAQPTPSAPKMPPVGAKVRFSVNRTAFVAGTVKVKGTLVPDIRIVRGYDPKYPNRILVNSASVGNGVAVALYDFAGTKIPGWQVI